MAKKKNRTNNEINAGSMADIAFLLLIFFLVTTQISEDKGILVRLPPWSNEPPPPMKLNSRNVLSVLVNSDNQLLVRGEPVEIEQLKDKTIEFISNPRKESDKSDSPRDAIVSLKNDRGTKYETYLEVYNELQSAYNALWEAEAKRLFSKSYEALSNEQKREVRGNFPMILSEAEPTSFGDEQ